MADHDDLTDDNDPAEVIDAYYARFGREADFDRWTMTGKGSLQLMQEALERNRPVTKADMQRVYKQLFGADLPAYGDGATL